ncbi:phosphotransferase [Shimia sp. SDUM112013]|uniref:aminoglycoside phosphotransferase family protein n=1 Tax=Shimia sp. SDUM112013 TaxID=3136160 RepID=UPI0032ED6A92
MTSRDMKIQAFLKCAGWAKAQRGDLAGDASNRRYERLVGPMGRAVLMDAPREKGEDVQPFIAVTDLLRAQGLSAPKILAKDAENGLLLLEDLGDDLFARVVARDPGLELPLYQEATDVLVALHKTPAPRSLTRYDAPLMAEMSALAWRWYLRGCNLPYEEAADSFEARFREVLSENVTSCDVLIQRDFHAENLLWLPEREGVQRVGLLDYQDAMAGHRAYDLVSLLQDARRDVPSDIEQKMINRYLDQCELDRETFLAAYALLGAQRNLRILGVFARLCMFSGKPHYVDFIPRVWGYLVRDLQHPLLHETGVYVLRDLPEPTPEILQRLRDKCATIPTL